MVGGGDCEIEIKVPELEEGVFTPPAVRCLGCVCRARGRREDPDHGPTSWLELERRHGRFSLNVSSSND